MSAARGACQLCSWVPVDCCCSGLMLNVKRRVFSECVSRNGTASTAHRTVQLLSHTGQLWAATRI